MRLPRQFYTAAWVIVFALGALVEAMALTDPGVGDELTSHLRWLLNWHPLIWWMGLGAAAWAIRHLWFGQK